MSSVRHITAPSECYSYVGCASTLMVGALRWMENKTIMQIAEMKTADSDSRILTDIELDEAVGGAWPSWRTTLLVIAIGLAFAA